MHAPLSHANTFRGSGADYQLTINPLFTKGLTHNMTFCSQGSGVTSPSDSAFRAWIWHGSNNSPPLPLVLLPHACLTYRLPKSRGQASRMLLTGSGLPSKLASKLPIWPQARWQSHALRVGIISDSVRISSD